MRVVVIGAGLGGLSAACHLVGRGHDVTVVEASGEPGGRAGRWVTNGYTIDTGPSVLTMPDILSETFAAAGADMGDFLRLTALDPLYRAGFPGDEPILLRRGREAMVEEIRRTCGPSDAAGFERFCDWLTELYRLERPAFIDRNYDGALDLVRPLAPALRLVRLGAFRKMASVVASYFSDHRLQKLFSFQALYAGLSPFDALAIYCVITYMDTVGGVWFPAGGIHSVGRGLSEAAGKAGARFRWNAPVSGILRRHGRSGPVTGALLNDGEVIAADAVVANPDLPAVYRALLPDVPAPRVARSGSYSPSCVLWLGAVRGSLPAGAVHHNVHFGSDWRGSFDALLRAGTLQADPAILVCAPALSDPGLAPAGGQVLYALEPVPNLDGGVDWAGERAPARRRLVDRLGSVGYPVGDVVAERLVTPLDWQAGGLERGTPFSLSHRFFQSGPFRPPNLERRVPGLVLVGSGTVPGVGVPMVLLSGRLAADRVDQLAREAGAGGVAAGRARRRWPGTRGSSIP